MPAGLSNSHFEQRIGGSLIPACGCASIAGTQAKENSRLKGKIELGAAETPGLLMLGRGDTVANRR
jgi:hypothetical protein